MKLIFSPENRYPKERPNTSVLLGKRVIVVLKGPNPDCESDFDDKNHFGDNCMVTGMCNIVNRDIIQLIDCTVKLQDQEHYVDCVVLNLDKYNHYVYISSSNF